jgi:hypothetical protein
MSHFLSSRQIYPTLMLLAMMNARAARAPCGTGWPAWQRILIATAISFVDATALHFAVELLANQTCRPERNISLPIATAQQLTIPSIHTATKKKNYQIDKNAGSVKACP